jgi:serine/threonine-protein kinase
LYRYPRYSRDGRVAVTIEEQRGDIYIVDPTLGTLRKLTTTGSNTQAIWTVDNERVLFASRRVGSNHYDIYWMPSDGSAVAEALITRDGGQFPTSWAPGGDLLALYELGNTSARDILVWSMRDKRIAQVLDTPANERSPTFSPDGRLLAYVSDAAGQDDVYVMRYPGPGGGEVVSSGGGTDPVWSPLSSPNRYELFYRRNDRIVAVTIRTEPRIAADPPRELFDGPYVSLPAGTGGRPNYDVAPDGRSFVMVRRADRSAMHLHVTENWFEQLRPRSAD